MAFCLSFFPCRARLCGTPHRPQAASGGDGKTRPTAQETGKGDPGGGAERARGGPGDGVAHYTEDGGESWVDLPGDTPVSMNLWGFGKSFLDEAEQRFAGWLTENLPVNPLKCEYFLPLVVTELIEENKAKIQVLRSTDKWFGVTYREDKPLVVEAIARKTAEGQYPENLWK